MHTRVFEVTAAKTQTGPLAGAKIRIHVHDDCVAAVQRAAAAHRLTMRELVDEAEERDLQHDQSDMEAADQASDLELI